jgi:hypothetical protein
LRDKIGGFASRESMEAWLNKWIGKFVDTGVDSPDEIKASRSPTEAHVGRGRQREPGLLPLQILPPAPLPTGRSHGFIAARLETAERQEMILRGSVAGVGLAAIPQSSVKPTTIRTKELTYGI